MNPYLNNSKDTMFSHVLIFIYTLILYYYREMSVLLFFVCCFYENNLTLIEIMYLFHFIECIFFKKMSQSANYDSTAYEEDWICFTCNTVAVNPLSLEAELLSETVVILLESNGTQWLKCADCDRRYHFNCIFNIPKNITDDEFLRGCYLCDECGWFLNGAYNSK